MPASSFPAVGDDNKAHPPDTNGAVGPGHLVVALNSYVQVQTKTGAVLLTVPVSNFFLPVSGGLRAFDPRVAYDPYKRRWIMTAAASELISSSAVLIAVSQNEDPTGKWFLYRIPSDPAGRIWADFPSLGFNRTWIVLQANMYDSTPSFAGSQIYVFDKAALYAGGQLEYTLIASSTIGATQAPAMTYDEFALPIYLLQSWTRNSATGFLRLYSITGAIGSEVLTPVAFPSAPAWGFDSPGTLDFAPQLGSAHNIQTGGSRIISVLYRDGAIWAAHTVFLPATGPTHSAAQWWQISTDGSVIQHGLVDDPSGRVFLAFPSIAVNKRGDALLGYSRFSATQWASANYSYRAASDPAGTMRADAFLKGGEAAYVREGGSGNRWGDYSATAVDPANDIDLWTIQEYAAARQNETDRWGTWWGRIVPPDVVPTASFVFSPSAPAVGLPVAFKDTSVGSPSSWLWDFGDGTSATDQNVSHAYASGGSYAVTLAASNSAGTHQVTKTVSVSAFRNCSPDAVCLGGGRFRFSAMWRTADGASGRGTAVQLLDDSGYFWFFGPTAIEVVVKTVNGCAFNNRYWVFAAGLTNVEVALTVTDTFTGAVKTYLSPQSTAFQPIQDTSAFSACP